MFLLMLPQWMNAGCFCPCCLPGGSMKYFSAGIYLKVFAFRVVSARSKARSALPRWISLILVE